MMLRVSGWMEGSQGGVSDVALRHKPGIGERVGGARAHGEVSDVEGLVSEWVSAGLPR